MSARVVSLRALVIEDCARLADRTWHHSVARLLRRADVSREDLTAASLDLRARSAHAAALAMLATDVVHAAGMAADILAEECGLSGLDWIVETAAEQRVALGAAHEQGVEVSS